MKMGGRVVGSGVWMHQPVSDISSADIRRAGSRASPRVVAVLHAPAPSDTIEL
jgi:hypothetical protein